MIDPLERWRELRREARLRRPADLRRAPYTQDPAELDGVDVAIVGAPTDDLVSDRPGTRFGAARDPRGQLPARARTSRPRSTRSPSCGSSTSATRPSCPPTRRARTRDRGDGRRRCSPPARSRSSSAATTRSPSPTSAPARPRTARVGLVHFDTHTDTGTRGLRRRGLARHADVPARRGRGGRPRALRADRPARLLARRGRVRVAGASAGSRASSCTTSARLGIEEVVEQDARRSSATARCS